MQDNFGWYTFFNCIQLVQKRYTKGCNFMSDPNVVHSMSSKRINYSHQSLPFYYCIFMFKSRKYILYNIKKSILYTVIYIYTITKCMYMNIT